MTLYNTVRQCVTRNKSEDTEENAEDEGSDEDVAEVTAEAAEDGLDKSEYPDEEGRVECRWCECEQDYEIDIVEGKTEYTTRCIRCGLKTWIQGDGWEDYKDLHDLSEGGKSPSDSPNAQMRSGTAVPTSSSEDRDSPTWSRSSRDYSTPRPENYTMRPEPSSFSVTVDTDDVDFDEVEESAESLSESLANDLEFSVVRNTNDDSD